MFFFGIILIIHGIYEEKFKKIKDNVKIQYRFVPRSYYDEQIFSNQFSSKFSNIFDEDQDEWSANQRSFTPYNIDDKTDKKLTKMFGSEYTQYGLYDEKDLNNVLKKIKDLTEDDFRKIYGSNAEKKDFVDVYGTTAKNIIKKYYDNEYINRINESKIDGGDDDGSIDTGTGTGTGTGGDDDGSIDVGTGTGTGTGGDDDGSIDVGTGTGGDDDGSSSDDDGSSSDDDDGSSSDGTACDTDEDDDDNNNKVNFDANVNFEMDVDLDVN